MNELVKYFYRQLKASLVAWNDRIHLIEQMSIRLTWFLNEYEV